LYIGVSLNFLLKNFLRGGETPPYLSSLFLDNDMVL